MHESSLDEKTIETAAAMVYHAGKRPVRLLFAEGEQTNIHERTDEKSSVCI